MRVEDLRRNNRAGRHRVVARIIDSKPWPDSARRNADAVWLADSLGAVGRFGDGDRLLRARLEDAYNPRLDPRPIATLQVARLRLGVRAAWDDPERARRLVWQARDWMRSLPPRGGEEDAAFDARARLIDGLLAERAGAVDDAIGHLSAAARIPVREAALSGAIRAALDRCVARRDPAAAFARRVAEVRIADRLDVVPRWLAHIVAREGDEALIEGLADAIAAHGDEPPAGDDPRGRARRALGRLAQVPELALHRAVWRAGLLRRLGRRDAAMAAVESLGEAPDPWPLLRQLIAFELRTDLDRRDAETLMRWWKHADPAVAMMARALVSGVLRGVGDVDGALEAAKAALGRLRAVEGSPLRFRLPAAWPGQHLAFETYGAALDAALDEGGALGAWAARVRPRFDRAMAIERQLGRQP